MNASTTYVYVDFSSTDNLSKELMKAIESNFTKKDWKEHQVEICEQLMYEYATRQDDVFIAE